MENLNAKIEMLQQEINQIKDNKNSVKRIFTKSDGLIEVIDKKIITEDNKELLRD